MVVMPSLIHETLNRSFIVKTYAPPNIKKTFGVVGLVPSFNKTKDWKSYLAEIADKDSVDSVIGTLKAKSYEKTAVLVNRYDRIDLPDDTCRILIFDSRPYSENLSDLYQEYCRPNSESTLMRTIRSVEQGMGRSVRGEKDYSVILVIGTDLIRLLRDRSSRRHLSSQMAKQIEIGLEVADFAKQEIDDGVDPKEAYLQLVRQCLSRDEDWKNFYLLEMQGVVPKSANQAVLKIYQSELLAEQAYIDGNYSKAGEVLQLLLDSGAIDEEDKSWYLQERARYSYRFSRQESSALQIAAHRKNRLLLRPATGTTVSQLTVVSEGRMERICDWIRKFSSYDDLNVAITDILSRLTFGVKAEKFEHALDELSRALGFAGERPDAEWKEGPDNLWALDDKTYLLFECKSEVDINRADVNKREAEQMNRSCAWFEKHYSGMNAKNIIIHPGRNIESAAAFLRPVEGMAEPDLRSFTKSCAEFFKSFESQNFNDLSALHIQKNVDSYKLAIEDVKSRYCRKLRNLR